jgi:Initiation factor 2 subunit family
MQAPSEAGDSDAGDPRSRRRERVKAEVWKGRSSIIEEMNELLDELDVSLPAQLASCHWAAACSTQLQNRGQVV